MRNYPTDSPQAVARILATVLVADGNVSKAELDVIEQVGAYEQVGLERNVMQTVLQTFCEDLLPARHPQLGKCLPGRRPNSGGTAGRNRKPRTSRRSASSLRRCGGR